MVVLTGDYWQHIPILLFNFELIFKISISYTIGYQFQGFAKISRISDLRYRYSRILKNTDLGRFREAYKS